MEYGKRVLLIIEIEAGGRWGQTYLYAISGSGRGGTWPYCCALHSYRLC